MVKKHSIRFTVYYGAAMLSLVIRFLFVSILVVIKNGLGDFRYPVGTIIGQEIRILPMYVYLFQQFSVPVVVGTLFKYNQFSSICFI